MAEVKTEQEPSIEEILESIRQIISDDTETAAAPAPAAEVKPEPVVQAVAPVPLSLTPVSEPIVPAPVVEEAILDLVDKVEPPPLDIAPPALPPQMSPPPPQPVAATETMDKPMTDEADTLISGQTADVATEART